ncbi:lipopolysaccharide transport periplasmic protein LptA [Solimonas terrae]|uniref:Lipopolysaccharide transport periplasmic protein LptA n=1 Tax=Solimonas terrae TaxID=1396819 RepID=A0A6M2BUZ2_9GAMM|nr:lipopolysaccharide transport periplasmic protein LptA [Solimonas terrae]NGY05819.1 lipopolysaccharide transport periplasmic protein LptA [Solimonas terrae]
MRPAASVSVLVGLVLSTGALAAEPSAPAAAAPAGATATKADAKPDARSQAEEMRPTGPVTVKADSAEWVQNNQMKYTGNVSMTSDTLVVHGDTMEVHQAADGQFEAWIHGQPATMDHAADPQATGAAARPLHAEAREIHYDSQSGTADLTGGAHVKRGDDEVDGETIGYVVPERRIRAASGGNGQVTITFQPPPAKSQGPSSDKKPKAKTP